MSEPTIIPTGGRIHVKRVAVQEQNRKSEGGIDLPDIAEQTADCEFIVLGVSSRPGFELPQWVAKRIAMRVWNLDEYNASDIEFLQVVCAQPREPEVKIGDHVLIDISLAIQVPGIDDEFFYDGVIYAIIEEGAKVELIKTQTDAFGYRTQ